jgi:hypothetical protein
MSMSEQRIQISQARPEMVLSRQVATANKMVLCAAHTVLSQDVINRMSNLGIRRLWVEGHPVEDATGKPFSVALGELRERFARCRNHPVMRDLQIMTERVMIPRM